MSKIIDFFVVYLLKFSFLFQLQKYLVIFFLAKIIHSSN